MELFPEIKQHTEPAKDEKVAVAKSVESLSGQRDVAEKINGKPEMITAKTFHDENKGNDG